MKAATPSTPPSPARRGKVMTTSVGTNQQAFTGQDWALFAAVSLIWGSSFVLILAGLETFEPGFVTWLRVGSGAAVLWLFPRARRRIEREDWARMVVISVVWVAIPFTLFPVAEQWITSAVTGMLNGATPIFTAVVASIMLSRLPRGRQVSGLVIGFIGVVLISLPSAGQGNSAMLGVALVVVATLFYGIGINLAGPMQQKYGALPVMATMLTLATAWTAPLGVLGMTDSAFSWMAFVAVLALGVVGTGLAFVIMGQLVGSVGGTRASFITYLIPVVAMILGVVLADETVAGLAVGGVALVIIGALLASRRET